jgi:hypothetical protein
VFFNSVAAEDFYYCPLPFIPFTPVIFPALTLLFCLYILSEFVLELEVNLRYI